MLYTYTKGHICLLILRKTEWKRRTQELIPGHLITSINSHRWSRPSEMKTKYIYIHMNMNEQMRNGEDDDLVNAEAYRDLSILFFIFFNQIFQLQLPEGEDVVRIPFAMPSPVWCWDCYQTLGAPAALFGNLFGSEAMDHISEHYNPTAKTTCNLDIYNHITSEKPFAFFEEALMLRKLLGGLAVGAAWYVVWSGLMFLNDIKSPAFALAISPRAKRKPQLNWDISIHIQTLSSNYGWWPLFQHLGF